MKLDVFPLFTVRSLLVRVDDHEADDLDDAARDRLVEGLDTPVLTTFLAADLLFLHPVVIATRTVMRFHGDSVLERAVDDDEMLVFNRADVGAPAAQIIAFPAPA